MNPKSIGCHIARLRRERGLTQEQLAEQLNVTNKTVSRWETGKYLPPTDALQNISVLFDISIGELLGEERTSAANGQRSAEDQHTGKNTPSTFSYKDKITYYKAKWKAEHRVLLWLTPCLPLGAVLAGILIGYPVYFIAAVILIPILRICIYNAMMTYVEQRAFDGTGSDNEKKQTNPTVHS